MSGGYAGVSALILNQQPKAMYAHCTAHCLDLAVPDLTDRCATISTCISFAKEIIDFVRRSPKCLAILKEISNQLSMSYSNLTPLCPIRWTMRAESYHSLLKNYERVQDALYSLAEEKGGPGYLIFSATEKLSRTIQSSTCCLEDVLFAAESVIHRFQCIQDTRLAEMRNGVVKDSVDLTDEPVLPRHRRSPRRYDSNSTFVNFSSCEEFYRQQYIEAFEIVINMLQNRYTQNNFKLFCNVENFIIHVANNSFDDINDCLQSIKDFCYGDIVVERLKAEALMIFDFCRLVIKRNQMNIKQVTKISTICEILNAYEIGKQMFKEYHKLLKLYLTIPVTTLTAERTFSALNRIKNVLRSSMNQPRLNHCLLPHIYKEKLDEIDPNHVKIYIIE